MHSSRKIHTEGRGVHNRSRWQQCYPPSLAGTPVVLPGDSSDEGRRHFAISSLAQDTLGVSDTPYSPAAFPFSSSIPEVAAGFTRSPSAFYYPESAS